MIHPTAEVSDKAHIGSGTQIWHQSQIREGANIGMNCIIGKGVYIDAGVLIGNNVKIQNYVSIYQGVSSVDGVFVGPHVCFTNDKRPRAVNADGSRKNYDDWVIEKTFIRRGASIGANATIICGITIGKWVLVGAGCVVTHDVPNFAHVLGNPSRIRAYVCRCGNNLVKQHSVDQDIAAHCVECNQIIKIPCIDWEQIE